MQSLKDYFIESMLDDINRQMDEIEEEYVAQLTALADREVMDEQDTTL